MTPALPLPEPEERTEVRQVMPIVTRKHRKQPSKQLKRIRAAVQAGNWSKAKWLTVEFLRSYHARGLAVRLAARKMRLNRRPDKLELDAIAEKLDAWRGTDEEVLVDIRRKQNDPNDFRQTMAFGIENRALQYLLLLALRELVDLHPSQYGLRGTHEAITAVAKAMSQGYSWAIECDVRDCFSSFDGRKTLNLLPVPERVGEKVLISEHLNLVAGPTLDYLFGCEDDDEWWPNLLDDELAKARRGIPQGSAVSPLIAEALLASAIRMVPETGVIVAFADNILLLAKSKEDVVSMTNGLRCALKAHPAGPLQPKLKYFHAGQPVEFLGHKLTVNIKGVRVEPSDLNLQKFKCRVTSELTKLQTLKPSTRAKRIQKLRLSVSSWMENFKLCDGIDDFKAHWLGRIKWA